MTKLLLPATFIIISDSLHLKFGLRCILPITKVSWKQRIELCYKLAFSAHTLDIWFTHFGIRNSLKKLVVSQIFCIFIGENQLVTKIFDMTTDYKVTELFYIIDEFCKHFDAENAGNLLEDNSGVKRRRRQASLSDSEIMTILLYFRYIPQFQALLPVLH